MSTKITAITHALVDPRGRAQYACGSISQCIGTYATMYCQGAIILGDDSRDRIFEKLVKDGWSIQGCEARVTVSHAPITLETVQASK